MYSKNFGKNQRNQKNQINRDLNQIDYFDFFKKIMISFNPVLRAHILFHILVLRVLNMLYNSI